MYLGLHSPRRPSVAAGISIPGAALIKVTRRVIQFRHSRKKKNIAVSSAENYLRMGDCYGRSCSDFVFRQVLPNSQVVIRPWID